MSIIYKTTLVPGKLELLAAWLPEQPWYGGDTPTLTKTGGFRLDDPAGEVGLEFMVATDDSTGTPVSYHVPLSYRAAPLAEAEDGFLGTTEHGVLGTRWVYDGMHDPVLVAQLLACIQGAAQPWMQSVSDTPDDTVVGHCAAPVRLTIGGSTVVNGTDVGVTAVQSDYRAVLRVVRVLQPEDDVPAQGIGHVTAGWRLPDRTELRGCFAVVTER
jgi:hypothetical protein